MIKKIIKIGLLVVFIGIVLLAGLISFIRMSVEGDIYEDLNDVPQAQVAIVLGAAVNPNTRQPSQILADRLYTAVELYKMGKVDKLLMSGDNRVTHYNEPVVMQQYALLKGVPEEDIVLDYAGRRTYDTCYRAKDIFKVEKAIMVTQQYHLYRTLYTCRELGVESYGVSSDRNRYSGQNFYNFREIAAIIKAFLDVKILHPTPILGEPLPID